MSVEMILMKLSTTLLRKIFHDLHLKIKRIIRSSRLKFYFRNHGWKGSMQIMEAAVSYFDLNDSRYVKLRNKINLKLIENGEFDHFYATRHGGQFIFYVRNLKFCQITKYDLCHRGNCARCFFRFWKMDMSKNTSNF